MIFVSFGANAFNIEDLYKKCKPFQNNGFTLDNLNETQQQNALMCLSHLDALRKLGYKNCAYLKKAYENKMINITAFETLSSLIANDKDTQINAVITSFVNFAENKPQKWKYTPSNYNEEFIGNIYPCKLDK